MHLLFQHLLLSVPVVFRRSRLALFLMLLAAFVALAATAPDRYILQLSGEPAAAAAVRAGQRAQSADPQFRARTDALLQQHARLRPLLEAQGAEVLGETTAISNCMFVRIPADRAASLANLPGVLRVAPVRLFQRTLDHALPLSKVPDAWNQIGGPGNAGAGIKVGIIDTGVDPQHPAFNDPSLVAPPGFPKTNRAADVPFTSNKVIVARSYAINSDGSAAPAIDTDGHGTSNAMISAGAAVTGPLGPLSGIAPKAFLGSYKVFPDDPNANASEDWIIRALNDAVSDGMDVINLSLGTVLAGRPGNDLLAATAEAATQAGKIVTISAGNSGSDPNTIGSPGVAPDAITVGSTWNDRDFAGSLQIAGGNTLAAYPGSGPNSSTPVSGTLVDISQFDPSGLACSVLPAGSLRGAIALILRGTCFFETKIDNAQLAGAAAVIVYTDAARPDPITMSVGAATLPAAMLDYQDGAALKQMLAGGPLQGALDFSVRAVAVDANRLSDFSSRGPSSDSGIKPDMVSVGEPVYKATVNGGFNIESGTSFAAPMVAGAAALIEAARPGLTAAQYRSLLINSAVPVVRALGDTLTIQQSGAGFLNVLNALNSNITVSPTSLSFGAATGSVDQTIQLNITNTGSAADTFSINVQPVGGGPAPAVSDNTLQLNPGQSQTVSVHLSAGALDPGAYQGFLQVQGTQNSVVAAVPYWYGVPSNAAAQVTVLDAPTNAPPLSRQTLVVRPTDLQGLPVTDTPSVTVIAGGGSVSLVQSVDDQVPGAFAIVVRVARGTNVYHVASGGASADIVIQSP